MPKMPHTPQCLPPDGAILQNYAYFQVKKLEFKLPRAKGELRVRTGLESRFPATTMRNKPLF